LSGRRLVHAGGLVVAPGFIDLHQHGQDGESSVSRRYTVLRFEPVSRAKWLTAPTSPPSGGSGRTPSHAKASARCGQ
jgi:imidazolonepropionase-like amidohydrolase